MAVEARTREEEVRTMEGEGIRLGFLVDRWIAIGVASRWVEVEAEGEVDRSSKGVAIGYKCIVEPLAVMEVAEDPS